MRLDEYLSKRSITNAIFAQAIGVNPATVSRLRRGERRPDLTTIQRIHEVTDGVVRAEDFFGNTKSEAAE